MSLPSAVRQLCCYSYSLHSFQVFISRPLYFCCNVHLSHKSFCLFFFFFKKTFISKYFHKDFQHHIAVSSQIFKWFHLRINVIFNCIMNSACSVKYLNTQQLQKLADPFFFFLIIKRTVITMTNWLSEPKHKLLCISYMSLNLFGRLQSLEIVPRHFTAFNFGVISILGNTRSFEGSIFS